MTCWDIRFKRDCAKLKIKVIFAHTCDSYGGKTCVIFGRMYTEILMCAEHSHFWFSVGPPFKILASINIFWHLDILAFFFVLENLLLIHFSISFSSEEGTYHLTQLPNDPLVCCQGLSELRFSCVTFCWVSLYLWRSWFSFTSSQQWSAVESLCFQWTPFPRPLWDPEVLK